MATVLCQRKRIVGGIFADVLYQCIASSSENYKKCTHYPQGIFSFLKVQNALSLGKSFLLIGRRWDAFSPWALSVSFLQNSSERGENLRTSISG